MILSGLTAIPRISTPTATELKKKARENMCTDKTYYSLIALPMCMGEVVWDLIDSVLDMCVILRIEPLKKVCRTIRKLRDDYVYHYHKFGLSSEQLAPLRAWCNNFLETTNGSSDMLKQIRHEVDRLYVDLQPEWGVSVASAYLAIVYAKGIIKYTEAEERAFAKEMGLPNHGHMLPSEIYRVIPLLEAVCGDCEISNDFLKPFISEVSDLMTDVSQSATEPEERTEYRHKCIAFVCNGGCKAQAVNGGIYGCFPSSACKRMINYDKKHMTV